MSLIANLRARFDGLVKSMTPRDRKLLTGLVVALPLLLLLGLGWGGRRALADLESRVVVQEEALASLKTLAVEHAQSAAKVEEIEANLRRYEGQDLASFVERAAQKTGISGNFQVREKAVSTEGTLEEKSFSVEVSKITLQQLVDLLYELETSGYPLRIRSMKTRVATVAGQKMLNASLEVSAFRLVETATEGGTSP